MVPLLPRNMRTLPQFLRLLSPLQAQAVIATLYSPLIPTPPVLLPPPAPRLPVGDITPLLEASVGRPLSLVSALPPNPSLQRSLLSARMVNSTLIPFVALPFSVKRPAGVDGNPNHARNAAMLVCPLLRAEPGKQRMSAIWKLRRKLNVYGRRTPSSMMVNSVTDSIDIITKRVTGSRGK